MQPSKCPSCDEPNDPELDCEFFGCARCDKEICESCAANGMCFDCDMEWDECED